MQLISKSHKESNKSMKNSREFSIDQTLSSLLTMTYFISMHLQLCMQVYYCSYHIFNLMFTKTEKMEKITRHQKVLDSIV